MRAALIGGLDAEATATGHKRMRNFTESKAARLAGEPRSPVKRARPRGRLAFLDTCLRADFGRKTATMMSLKCPLQGTFCQKRSFRYLLQSLAKSPRAVTNEAANMTRPSLSELHQRYVIERRPLEASLEEILRVTAARERALFWLRSQSGDLKTGPKDSGFARCFASKRFSGTGHDAVAGVDEAGMSPLAGPVSAAAVILKPGTRITGIDDSKKLDSIFAGSSAKKSRKRRLHGMLRLSKSRKLTRSISTGRASSRCGGQLKGCDQPRSIF